MKSMSQKIGAYFVAMAAMMWGFDAVVLTPRLYNLNVVYVVFVLHALPFLVMQPILFKEYTWIKRMRPHDITYLFLVALFGGALGTIAIVKALFLVEFKHLTVVALLQKLQPVFALVLARVVLKERLSSSFLLWSCIAIAGGYFLTFQLHPPTLVHNGKMLPAALLALVAAFSFGSATVFGKRILNLLPFQTALFFRYGLTTLIMLAIVIPTGAISQVSITTSTNWIFFCIIGLTTGSGAILLYYYGLRHITAGVGTICELLFPISSIVFDYIFNGHILSPIQWISAVVMLFAIWRIGNAPTRPQKAPATPC
ncbi:MAG: DMT family transporter [Desulfobacterales bacterium]|nr:DMT family transporter [Desulfobacterales bacterium]